MPANRCVSYIFGLLALFGSTAAFSEPVLIRTAFVVPVSNWAPMLEEKKDLAKHWGNSYVMQAVRYQGTPLMITALANEQSGNRQPGLFDARPSHSERRSGGSPHHR